MYTVGNFERYKDIILVLTLKELKVRYKGSFLGYVWSVLNPLLLAVVFYFAFKVVVRIPIENYSLFLISGLFPWHWFASSVGTAPSILLSNASIIKKVNFPRYLLPMASVLNDMVHFILSLPVLLFFGLAHKIYPSFVWFIGIPFLLFAQFLLVYGISLILSAINVFFRDLERLVFIGITLLFYLTPVFYDVSLVPEKYKLILSLNPMFGLITLWRGVFLNNTFDFSLYVVYLFYCTLVFIIGFYVFNRLSWKFAEVL